MPLSYASRFLRALVALAALAAAPGASAQITITRADVEAQLLASGETTSYEAIASAADLARLQALAARVGGGQTWDLSTVAWDNLTTSTVAPAPGPVLLADSFATATHVVRIVTDTDTAYSYHELRPGENRSLGIASRLEDENGEPAVGGLRFAPYDLAVPLPLTASSTWSSAYELRVIPAIDVVRTDVMSTSMVEGWGTLVTPAGSAPALKVRTKEVSTSTLSIPDIPPIVTRDSTVTIEFVTTGGVSASIGLDGEGQASWAIYGTSAPTGGEPTASASGPGVAFGLAVEGSNPVRRGAEVALTFSLDAPSAVRIEAIDVLGRCVATLATDVRGAGPQRAALATSALPAGVYVVRLAAGGRTAALPITVVD